MNLFDRCISVVLRREGGYANDPNDKGKETYMGISRRWHPNWNGWPIIDAHNANCQLKRGEFVDNPEFDKMVYNFYYNEFWMPLNIDELENPNIALQIFDFAVNAGTVKAIKTAQRLSGVRVDGIIGINTIKAINSLDNAFLIRYKHARKEYYTYIVDKDPSQEKFIRGWINRVDEIKVV